MCIDTQYTDDCGYAVVTKNKSSSNYIKNTIPGVGISHVTKKKLKSIMSQENAKRKFHGRNVNFWDQNLTLKKTE